MPDNTRDVTTEAHIIETHERICKFEFLSWQYELTGQVANLDTQATPYESSVRGVAAA